MSESNYSIRNVVEPISMGPTLLAIRKPQRAVGGAVATRTLDGSGRRFLRELLRDGRCCASPGLARDSLLRFYCSHCGLRWSVSHSAGFIIAARSRWHVGIDIQSRVRRDAALRWLNRTAQIENATLEHWSVAEAALKALGNAGTRADVHRLRLPEVLGVGWTTVSIVAIAGGRNTSDQRAQVLVWSHAKSVGALAILDSNINEKQIEEN